MVRSLSFIHLFVILAVSYIGGAILFREIPISTMEKLISFFDPRVVYGHQVGFVRPVAMTALFFVIAFILSNIKQARFTILFLGALKSVLFGLSSAFLLGSGMKILDYSIWWFPFQFITCFLFLAFCAILNPPFFLGRNRWKKQSTNALPIIIIMSVFVTILEIVIFYILLK